jgi:hypothetical protein
MENSDEKPYPRPWNPEAMKDARRREELRRAEERRKRVAEIKQHCEFWKTVVGQLPSGEVPDDLRRAVHSYTIILLYGLCDTLFSLIGLPQVRGLSKIRGLPSVFATHILVMENVVVDARTATIITRAKDIRNWIAHPQAGSDIPTDEVLETTAEVLSIVAKELFRIAEGWITAEAERDRAASPESFYRYWQIVDRRAE